MVWHQGLRVYDALRDGGIFICFENVVPERETVKKQELLRWGRYQQRNGKTEAEALAHNARCGTSYFPLTVREHIDLLNSIGFTDVHVFWYSYMQMGVYAFKRLQIWTNKNDWEVRAWWRASHRESFITGRHRILSIWKRSWVLWRSEEGWEFLKTALRLWYGWQRHNGEGSFFGQKGLVRAFSVTQYTEQEKTPPAEVVRGVAVFMGLLS